MKPIDVKDNTCINTDKEINNKAPKFKVRDRVRMSKYKNIFTKGYTPNWSEEVFVIKKVKNTVPWTYVINDLNGEEIIGTFYEKELQKTNQEELRIEKVIKRKGDKIYVKWKGYDNSFNSWIDKASLIKKKKIEKRTYKMSQYFPPFNNYKENIKVELDLSNYATKQDTKDITHIDANGFASKTNLAALKTEIDKIDADKLKTVPIDLEKLSNVVKNEVVKKNDYNALKSKVDGIDVSKYVGRTKYETDGKAIYDKIDAVEKKIPVLNDFVTTARFNHEENLLATKTALTTVENKIPDVSTVATITSLNSLLPVSTFNNKVTELEGKVTTVDNKFSGFVKKTDYGAEVIKIKNDYATNASLDSKLNDLKAQHIATEVKSIDDKTKKNASDILAFESRLKQKEDIIDDVQRDNALINGRDYYRDEMYLLYECRTYSFKTSTFTTGSILISNWKSTGINNYSRNSDMDGGSGGINYPTLIDNGRMSVNLTAYI